MIANNERICFENEYFGLVTFHYSSYKEIREARKPINYHVLSWTIIDYIDDRQTG